NRLVAGQRSIEIGIGHLDQALELTELVIGEVCDLGVGKATEDQIHLARTAVPAAEQKPLAPEIEAVARSSRSSHLQSPVQRQKPGRAGRGGYNARAEECQ